MLIVIIGVFYFVNNKKPINTIANKIVDLSIATTTTTIPEYIWPESDNLKECLESSKGQERDIGEPCYFSGESYVYYSKATISGITYGVVDGWVWTPGIKTSGDKLSFSLDEEFGSSEKLEEINNNFFDFKKIKLLDNNKEIDITSMSQLSNNEVLNARIYYTLPKVSYFDKIINWLYPSAMAKLEPMNTYNTASKPSSNNDLITDSIDYTISKNSIYKIVFQKPTSEERIIDNTGQAGILGLYQSYIGSKAKDSATLIKFTNSKDWITIKFADGSPYWTLEKLLDYANSNTYIDFYCSKFNNSCMFVEKKTTWEFNFDFNGFDKEIVIPINYQSSDAKSYSWESNTSIMFFNNRMIDYPIDISKFIANNPKLQRKNNEEWTEKGIMTLTGNIYCGKLNDLINKDEPKCSLNVLSLSFK